MGTNYYAIVPASTLGTCPHCHRDMPTDATERLHIGKSSAGWKFIFRAHEGPLPQTAAAWLEFLKDKPIEDEYDGDHDYDDFVAFVRRKQDEPQQQSDPTLRDSWISLDAEGYNVCRAEFS